MILKNDQYTKHPSTWLNGKEWESEIETKNGKKPNLIRCANPDKPYCKEIINLNETDRCPRCGWRPPKRQT